MSSMISSLSNQVKVTCSPSGLIYRIDFLTKSGARAYFYHHILHDWSDENCIRILENVVSAMTPDYSKLLIHDMIIPDQGASIFAAELDMTMMAFNGGLERTKVQWRALLNSVDLQGVDSGIRWMKMMGLLRQ